MLESDREARYRLCRALFEDKQRMGNRMTGTARTRQPRQAKNTDELADLLRCIRSGVACVPVKRPGLPGAVLISEREYKRLQAIDKSPHAEIIGRLLFAPRV